MSRPVRVLSNTGMYHVIFRGINRQDIFEEEKDYEKMIEIIKRVHSEIKFEIYAYCLMTNHVHLFIKEIEPGDIKKIMHKILSIYATWFNFKYERSGSLIGNRYKSEPIEDERYYLSLLRYIHQNPLKAKMVTNLNDYKWSSYNSYKEEKEDFVNKEFALNMFNADRTEAIESLVEFHKEIEMENYEISNKIKLSDSQMRRKMQTILQMEDLSTIKNKPKTERNEIILKLRKNNFSIREIERITGVSRGIVSRINKM